MAEQLDWFYAVKTLTSEVVLFAASRNALREIGYIESDYYEDVVLQPKDDELRTIEKWPPGTIFKWIGTLRHFDDSEKETEFNGTLRAFTTIEIPERGPGDGAR